MIEALEDPPSFEVATVELFGPFQAFGLLQVFVWWFWGLGLEEVRDVIGFISGLARAFRQQGC